MLYWLMNLGFAGGLSIPTGNPLSVIRMSGEAITVISMRGVYEPAVETAGESISVITFSGRVEEGS
jgi:hypothetical protein